jgi:hypothetical protein
MILSPSFVIAWAAIASSVSAKLVEHTFKPANFSDDIGYNKCNYSNISMPLWASSLPAPPAGQQLLHVAIGRGTLVCNCAMH